MGAMKAIAMEVSCDMGFGGDLPEEVLREAQRRLDAGELDKPAKSDIRPASTNSLLSGGLTITH